MTVCIPQDRSQGLQHVDALTGVTYRSAASPSSSLKDVKGMLELKDRKTENSWGVGAKGREGVPHLSSLQLFSTL